MTTKQNPATPLPWAHDYSTRPIAFPIGSNPRETPIFKAYGEHPLHDARYIVLACNAYPRLIAAIRGITSYHNNICPGATETEGRAIYDAAALLRDLGELT